MASGRLSREGSVLPSTLTNKLGQEVVFSLPAKGMPEGKAQGGHRHMAGAP